MPVLTCEMVAEQELVERYLSRSLPESEAADFEAHYLTCANCQGLLRLGVGVRHTLGASVEPSRRGRWMLVAGSLGLAAGLAGILLLRPENPSALTNLGGVVQAPLYLGIPVRSEPPASPDSLFAEAMQHYALERFDRAATGLEAALRAGVDPAPAEFFLGASRLMLDRSRDAGAAFERVISLGDSPYLSEARYYRAKTLLRLGRGSEALAELEAVPAANSVVGVTARALADSIREVLRR